MTHTAAALTKEYSTFKVSSEHTVSELELATKRDQATIAAQQAQLKKSNDELSALTKLYKDLTTAKAAVDKQVESLTAQGKKDALEITGQKQKLLDLSSTLKAASDELAVLTKKHTELTSAKAAVDKQVETLTAQGKKDASDIAVLKKQLEGTTSKLTVLAAEYQSYKTTSEKTVSDLNASLTKVKEEHAQHLKECKLAAEKAAKGIADLQSQLAALTKEYQAYKTTSEKTVSDLNATSSQLKEKLLSLAKEYQGFKSSSEMSINSVTVSLNKVQSEYAQHLNICTADKAAAQSTIDELEGFVKKPRGFECTDSVSGGNRGFSMPSKSGHVAADNKGNGSLVTYVHPGEMPSAVVTGPTDLRAAMGLSAAGATADRSAPTDLRATMGLPHGTGSVISAGGEGTESTADRPPEGVIFNWWDLITPSQ